MKMLTVINTGEYRYTIANSDKIRQFYIHDLSDGSYLVLDNRGTCLGTADSLPLAQQIADYVFQQGC